MDSRQGVSYIAAINNFYTNETGPVHFPSVLTQCTPTIRSVCSASLLSSPILLCL